jgi:hypothetical protein
LLKFIFNEKNYLDASSEQLFAVENFWASLAPFHHSKAIIPPKAATANIGETAAALAVVTAVPAIPFTVPDTAVVASAIIFLLLQWLNYSSVLREIKKELYAPLLRGADQYSSTEFSP